MTKRVLLTAGLVFAFAAFGFGQNQNTTQNAPPEGTQVTKRETSSVVHPKNAPIKVTSGVIENAQKKLNDAGYNSGPVDGILGPQTRAALRKYQGDQKLAQTGRLDQKTLAALNVGGVNELAAAPADLGRGGKAIGHNVKEGHPVGAAKAAETGAKNFGKKVGQGTESLAVKTKDKVGSGISTVGRKITGAGETTQNAGENTTNENTDKNQGATNNQPDTNQQPQK